MADDKKTSKSLGEIVPSITLTKEQKDALNDMADEIDEIDLKPIPGKNIHRGKHVLGSLTGIKNDKELEKLKMPPEIETVQRFINMITEIKFLKTEQVEEDGVYNKQVFDTVKEMQVRINAYLAQKIMGVYVPSSIQEKKLVPSIAAKITRENKALKGNLYNAVEGKIYETTVGKATYKVRMGIVTDAGRAGIIDIFDEEGKRLKKISISVDEKGKIAVNGTMLYGILVDGFVGVETLRAATAVLKDMVGQKKEIPTPMPMQVSLKVGYSFKNDLAGEWTKNIRAMLISQDPNALKENSKAIEEVNSVLLNLSYSQEKVLRDNPIKLKLGWTGNEYTATWQGMMLAHKNGIGYEEFLEKWMNALKNNPETKELALKAVKGKLEVPKELPKYVLVGEAKGGSGGALGVDLTDIGQLFKQAKENIEQNFESGPLRNFLLKDVNNRQKQVEDKVMELAHKAEKSKGNVKEKLIELLNSDREVATNIYLTYVFFGNMVGSQNFSTFPLANTQINEKEDLLVSLQKYIEKSMSTHGDKAILNVFNDEFRKWTLRKNFSKEDTRLMAEAFYDKYVVEGPGKQAKKFLNLEDMSKSDIKTFALMFKWDSELNKSEMADAIRQKDRKSLSQIR